MALKTAHNNKQGRAGKRISKILESRTINKFIQFAAFHFNQRKISLSNKGRQGSNKVNKVGDPPCSYEILRKTENSSFCLNISRCFQAPFSS